MSGILPMAVLMRVPLSGAALVAVALLGSACGERAQLPLAAGIGPDPVLPPPRQTLLPTV